MTPEALSHVLAAEEPGCVLTLEAGQAAVGHVAADGSLARMPPGPAEGIHPLRQPRGIGFPARGQDPLQRPRLPGRGQVPTGEVVTGRASGQPGGACDLPHGQPGACPY